MEGKNLQSSPRFSPEVESVLLEAGWFPDRQVEESRLEQWYVLPTVELAAYCRIFPAAHRFLREFGDLELSRYKARNLYYRETFIIDPLKGAQGGDDDFWLIFEWVLETSLYPLGAFDSATIVIDTQGRIWNVWDDLVLLGNSPEEGISNLILDKWIESRIRVGDHLDKLPLIEKIGGRLKKFCSKQRQNSAE